MGIFLITFGSFAYRFLSTNSIDSKDNSIYVAGFCLLLSILTLALWKYSSLRKSEVHFANGVKRSERRLYYLALIIVSFFLLFLSQVPPFIAAILFLPSLFLIIYLSNNTEIKNYKTGVLESLSNFLTCKICLAIGYFINYLCFSGFCLINSSIDLFNCAVGFVPNLISALIFYTPFAIFFSFLYPLKFIKSNTGALDDMNF